jgi:hypothetical protein
MAIACLAVHLCSLSVLFWLSFQVQSYDRPNQPQPELGRIHPSNNHGSLTYATDVEETGMSLLAGGMALGCLGGFIILPKRYTAKGIEHDLTQLTFKQYVLFAVVFSVYLFVVLVAGRNVVGFLISHRVVLTWV